MIFVTVGTQEFQFNRLLQMVNKLIENKIINDYVYAQIGSSSYIPKNYEYIDFLDKENFNKHIKESSFIISHAGVGNILSCLQMKKKIVIIPRLKKYKEHVDDHQIQIAEEFSKKKYVLYAKDYISLEKIIRNINSLKTNPFKESSGELIKDIEKYINSL